MMRTIIFLLAYFLVANSYAQNNTSAVYLSNETSPIVLEKSPKRLIVGGTIIKVKYEGSFANNATIKGAFEYACRIWEESIPTTFPINLIVKFASISNSLCLASTDAQPGGFQDHNEDYEKIAVKRYGQTYGFSYMGWDITLEYLRDSPDAIITFSTKQPFDYTLDGAHVNPNKYDFVTVAMQAIGKALGFSLKAYPGNMELTVSHPSNQYTTRLLSSDNAAENYQKAISGTAYIKAQRSDLKWLLHCPASYEREYSLGFFQKDSKNLETLIMQPGISKGTAIRYIGEGIRDFFSFCGWDRDIVVGMGSSNYHSASTDNIIPFQKSPTKNNKSIQEPTKSIEDEDIYSYMSDKTEDGSDGVYLLLKDGSWLQISDFPGLGYFNIDPNRNEEYARTSDGYLRLKLIKNIYGPGGYSNLTVSYHLYDYFPQKPKSSFNNYIVSEFKNIQMKRRSYNTSLQEEDEFLDVEIGFQNTEGCTSILVEQTDADYDIPYTYFVDPKKGYFIAYMNKKYASIFKLTYINKNGETIGLPMTIDLTSNLSKNSLLSVDKKENTLRYEILSNTKNKSQDKSDGTYLIYNIENTTTKSQGTVVGEKGEINIENLPKGTYILSITYKGNTYSMKWNK